MERMLELHKLQAAARTPADRGHYARQIEATDREIDALVYELQRADGGGNCGGAGVRATADGGSAV
jgi:hypothetical protein